MAALSRFISRLGEKGLPFFKLLKVSTCFPWSDEVDIAFKQLKLFLTKPPIMMAPQPDETLLIYIAATSRVVSIAITIERKEARHTYKKLLYAILVTSHKLRHYFEYYNIMMVTKFPLGDILCNKEANNHIIKWAIKLSTYSIEFRSRPTIKSQVLTDFVAEWTEIQEPIPTTCPEHWVMYFDGVLNINSASVGILFIMLTKDRLRYILRIHFPASNNATEYEACIHGLYIAIELGVKCLMVYGDSALVIYQGNKDWSYSSEKMDAYCTEIRKLKGSSIGLDMIGPFKPTPGGFQYVYVTIDKFSKWIEYKLLVLATLKKAVELFEDIIHIFGLPNSIIIDLKTTFTGHHFWDFYED
ncbi:uncharacterized protein [Miscanthus floridulus]|uniref:uncharacterized protein n=1 Tax=Miscanthus floridulus TaxID=154761 RepID=UPI00345B089D